MQTAVRLTDWPSDLDAPAKKLAALPGDLALVLNADTPDLAKVSPSSTAAHAAWHDFSQAVWSHPQAPRQRTRTGTENLSAFPLWLRLPTMMLTNGGANWHWQ